MLSMRQFCLCVSSFTKSATRVWCCLVLLPPLLDLNKYTPLNIQPHLYLLSRLTTYFCLGSVSSRPRDCYEKLSLWNHTSDGPDLPLATDAWAEAAICPTS
jgi:hypothetical protein